MRILFSLCCLPLLAAGCVPPPQKAGGLEEPSTSSAPAQAAPTQTGPARTLLEAPFYIEIQGHVFYRDRVRLAPNFLCLVRLMDMGGWDSRAEPKEIDQAIIPGPLTLPLPYTLAMEGHLVNPKHTYVVEAFIFAPENPQAPDPAAGTILFRSKAPVPVLTRGNSALADIQLTMQPPKP